MIPPAPADASAPITTRINTMSSSKDVGANCFLNSPYMTKTMGPNPVTTRGEGTHINFHPKDKSIIYASGKYIVLKNLDDPTMSFIYRGHAHTTTVAKVSPNGYWIASGDITGKLRVWSFDNPEHLTKLEFPAFSGAIRDIDWDHESKKIVVVGEGSGIMAKVITWDTGNSAGEMLGHAKRILSCTYKPSRPFRMMTCAEDFRICFYEGPPFKMKHSRQPFSNFANCIRYSPDGTLVVCVGEKKIQLLDGTSGEETLCLANAHAGTIYSVAWSPDSKRIVTCSGDKTVKIWSLALDCLVVHAFSAHIGDMQVAVQWTPTRLLSVSLNGNINLLDTEAAGALGPPLQEHQNAISCVCYNPTTELLYTGDNNGVIISRNLVTGVTVRLTGCLSDKSVTGSVHGGKVTALAVVAESLVSVGFDDTLRFTRLDSTVMESDSVTLNGQPWCLSALPGGGGASSIFAVATSNEVALFSGRSRVTGILLPNDKFSCNCVALASEAEVILGCSDFKTRVFSIGEDKTLTLTATIETRSAVTALALHPSCDFLAVGDNGRQVEVYERGSWVERVKAIWAFHTSKVNCLAWSPSGNYLASGSVDECIIIWDFINPSKKLILPYAHSAGVSSLVWIDDTKLVSVGNDHVIVTWAIPSTL